MKDITFIADKVTWHSIKNNIKLPYLKRYNEAYFIAIPKS